MAQCNIVTYSSNTLKEGKREDGKISLECLTEEGLSNNQMALP